MRLIEASQFYEELLGHVPVGQINAAWFQYIMHPRYRSTPTISKRLFDFAVGSVALVAFAPLIALFAVAIKLSDGGPVFYRQRRIGEGGRDFEMVKLRSMRPAAQADGAQWSSRDDDRVLPVGRIMRKLHIDELPQLWNVLRGEMTLVGPRPEQPELVGELERRFPHYERRSLVKPGITGWAQVRCGYAGTEGRIRLEALPRPLLPEAPLAARGSDDHLRDGAGARASSPVRPGGTERAVPSPE